MKKAILAVSGAIATGLGTQLADHVVAVGRLRRRERSTVPMSTAAW